MAHKGIVLVVDDDQDIRQTLGELLENAGYLVLEARDGGEALERARGLTGRIVAVVDLVMPEMDGWELIARMKSDSELARVPIVVITADGPEAVKGAEEVIPKPLSPAKILSTVERYCRVNGADAR